jgi:hypothetical protein
MTKQSADIIARNLDHFFPRLTHFRAPEPPLLFPVTSRADWIQAQAKKTAGTKVTRESFMEWRERFEAELASKRDREEQERLRALPVKERDEVKRTMGKLSGRELFARQLALDNKEGEEGEEEDGGEVDYERYEKERKERLARGEAFDEDDEHEDEQEREARDRLKAVSLSDEE